MPDKRCRHACRPYYLLHYTYGMDYTLEVSPLRGTSPLMLKISARGGLRPDWVCGMQGEFTPGKYGDWRFDKRTYAQLPPPRRLSSPPNGMSNELVRHLVDAINEATTAIPNWDDYAKTGVARELWNGEVALR